MTYTFDATIISDLHKDARSYRPCALFWAEWDSASDDEKQTIWDNLCKEVEYEIDAEKRRQNAALADFEKKVQECIALGAKDRDTALEWVIESLNFGEFDLRYGGSYICFELDLPYSKATEFDPICKKLLKKLEEAKNE